MSSSSLALIVSALGGALGALLLRSLLRLAGKLWAAHKPLATYDCADDTRRPGGIWHGRGRRVPVDPLATNKRSWEHSSQHTGTKHVHTIYGPYVNDFGRPAYYRVSFRIYGDGFGGSEDPVVVLDVIQRPLFLGHELVVMGQRVIRGKELSNEYREFEVYCYAGGSGTYEYRCLVHSEVFDEHRHTLRFDAIGVYIHVPAWEIL
jgi:hypothetical protein